MFGVLNQKQFVSELNKLTSNYVLKRTFPKVKIFKVKNVKIIIEVVHGDRLIWGQIDSFSGIIRLEHRGGTLDMQLKHRDYTLTFSGEVGMATVDSTPKFAWHLGEHRTHWMKIYG